MRTLEPITLDSFSSAPFLVTETLRLKASPGAVFDAFADAPMWTRWWPLMSSARWTNGEGGLDSEREVSITALGRYRERFLAWERGVRFAFSMIGTTSPLIDQMGEDYRLFADGKGTRLEWTAVSWPRALGKATTPVTRLILSQMIRRGIPKLDRLLSAN